MPISLTFVLLLAAALTIAMATRERLQTLTLDHFENCPDETLPGLSIVVAARDEAGTVGPALNSLLSLDYPDLEIVFVDDRSRDGTGSVAEECRRVHPNGKRLTVLRCEELPSGWLGKLHALHIGCQATTKPMVLLTDADVLFQEQSLKRAVSASKILSADHLVVAPQILARGFWEPVLVAFFLILFATRFRPSTVHRRKDRYVGVGAFNLLTREALTGCDFLRPLRLQVIDDVHLGRLIKSRGFNQFCVVGMDYVRVRWFEGLGGCVKGLEKNAYAGLKYNPAFAALVVLAVAAPFWTPLLLTLVGLPQWAAGYLLFLLVMGWTIPPGCHLPRWVGLAFPLASLVLAITFARSAWLTEKQGGVRWRGTLYDLAELRQAHHEFISTVAPL